jgi:hypothetical protein
MSRPRIDFGRIGVDLGIGVGLALVWFGLSALMLWPFGKAALSLHVLEGYPLYVAAVIAATVACMALHKIFRMESDPPRDPFTVTNLLVSAFVQTGWAAFVALTVRSFAPDTTTFATVVLHFIGFVASYVATATTSAFFQGSVYQNACVGISAVAYILFALWPALARAAYGWFFAFW